MADTKREVAKNNGAKRECVRVTATLSPQQYGVLNELSAKNKVSVAWLIRKAVDRLVEEVDGGRRLPFDL